MTTISLERAQYCAKLAEVQPMYEKVKAAGIAQITVSDKATRVFVKLKGDQELKVERRGHNEWRVTSNTIDMAKLGVSQENLKDWAKAIVQSARREMRKEHHTPGRHAPKHEPEAKKAKR